MPGGRLRDRRRDAFALDATELQATAGMLEAQPRLDLDQSGTAATRSGGNGQTFR